MPKNKELRIYRDAGCWWMDYCGDLTDEIYHSPKGSWVGAIFRKTRGAVLILTNRKKLVLRFGIGEPVVCSISDSGVAGVAEFGSGGHGRVRFFFPDGTSSQAGKIKNIVQIDHITFDASASEATLWGGQQIIQHIHIPSLDRKAVPKAIAFKKTQ